MKRNKLMAAINRCDNSGSCRASVRPAIVRHSDSAIAAIGLFLFMNIYYSRRLKASNNGDRCFVSSPNVASHSKILMIVKGLRKIVLNFQL